MPAPRPRRGRRGFDVATYRFSRDERPVLPGAPFTPRHTGSRRAAYAGVGVVLAVAATFPDALVTVNVGTIAGSLGLYVARLPRRIARHAATREERVAGLRRSDPDEARHFGAAKAATSFASFSSAGWAKSDIRLSPSPKIMPCPW